ncbi:MAG: hypothetical protein AAB772_03130 [Patescibacteria group bacterium]
MIYFVNFSAFNLSGNRSLYALIVIDADYIKQNPHWKIFLPNILDETKRFYEEEFQISLKSAGLIPILSQKDDASMKEFALYDISKNDIIIGFTGRKLPKSNNTPVYGYANSFIVLITNQFPPTDQTKILKHELAHLFSAGHKSGTIMDKKAENFLQDENPDYKKFNSWNKTIIKFNKYRNFKIIKLFYRIYYRLVK